MRKYLVIATSIIFIGAISLYYGLGGSNELIFEVVELPAQKVYGESFEGRPRDPKLEALFVDTRGRSQENLLELVVINTDTPEKDNISQFIGTLNGPTSSTLDIVEIPDGRFVVTKISSHNLVMPSPEDIRDVAVEFASRQSIELITETSYEFYKGDSVLVVMFQSL